MVIEDHFGSLYLVTGHFELFNLCSGCTEEQLSTATSATA